MARPDELLDLKPSQRYNVLEDVTRTPADTRDLVEYMIAMSVMMAGRPGQPDQLNPTPALPPG